MKTKLLPLAAALMLAACANDGKQPENSQESPKVGMANPASVFCEQQGGKSEVRKDAQGNEYGMCRLPDGRVVDEWEFYRANNK